MTDIEVLTILERMESHLGEIGPVNTRWFRADGRIIFPVIDTDYRYICLVSGNQRYGITFKPTTSERELGRDILRGLRSLRNQTGAAQP